MGSLTREQAIALFDNHFWMAMTDEERARFQLYEERLCMPFDVFQASVAKTLGRSVFTHEFAKPDLLRKELDGEREPPTMQEIIEMIPEDKRILLAVKGDNNNG